MNQIRFFRPISLSFISLLYFTLALLPLASCSLSETIRGVRLSWYGLPVPGGTNRPLIPGRPIELVICWNYGENKNPADSEKFRFILKAIDEDDQDLWEAKLFSEFQSALYAEPQSTESEDPETLHSTYLGSEQNSVPSDPETLRRRFPNLPEDLSSCYQGSVTLPAKLPLDDRHEYQLYLMKLDDHGYWNRYSSILSLQVGKSLRVKKKSLMSVLKSPFKNPKTALAIGFGLTAVYGAMGVFPVMAVGLVVAGIAIYEIIAGELIKWHGLPTQFSAIQIFSPLHISTLVVCHRRSFRKLFMGSYEKIANPDFRLVLQQIAHGKPHFRNITTNFSPATEQLRERIPTLPKNLEHCYAASFKMPENVVYHPDVPLEMLLVKRESNGHDKVFGSFQLKPGENRIQQDLFSNTLDIGKEAALAVGPALVVVGATHGNFVMMGVGFAVTGLGMGILLSQVHPSTFIGKEISWHHIPPDTQEQEVDINPNTWIANTKQQFVLCQTKPKNLRGIQKFFYVLEEISPKSSNNEEAKVLLSIPAVLERIPIEDWKAYPKEVKEDTQKAFRNQLCYQSEIQLPDVPFLANQTYRLSLVGLKEDGSLKVLDPLYFHARLKKRYRYGNVLRAGAVAMTGTGSYLIATGITSHDIIKSTIGLCALGIGVFLSHHKKHHAAEGTAHTALETAIKGLLKAF